MLYTYCCLSLVMLARLAQAGGVSYSSSAEGRLQCTVTAHGTNTSDVASILTAFEYCGNGCLIVFPEGQNYFIDSKMNPIGNNVVIDWHGIWTFSPDLSVWRNKTYHIEYQNHWTAIALSGNHITINGHGTGGIHGNGNAWWNEEQTLTQPGRPMALTLWNVSDVTVNKFLIRDSPLWSFNIMNGTNVPVDELYVNNTAVNAPFGSNWVQNTDGFDTMDSKNVRLTNFVYQGCDDCIAIKGRSYNVYIHNVTCNGGNGITVGSFGQFLADWSVANIVIDDVRVLIHNNDQHNSAYLHTYIGAQVPDSFYEAGGQLVGGGWGTVRDVTFSNFVVHGARNGPVLSQADGDNGSYTGTSKMQVYNVNWVNFTGYLNGNTAAGQASCSQIHPCYGISMDNITLYAYANSTVPNSDIKAEYIRDGGLFVGNLTTVDF